MARSLTIKLPDDSGQTLEELGRRQCRSAEDVAEDILERALAVARWRQNREQLQSRAEAASFRSEDDILDAISSGKDSPANGTPATITELMSGP